MKILEEFWYGNIEPTDYDTSSCKEYKKLQELICRNEEKLRATMTDEQKEQMNMISWWDWPAEVIAANKLDFYELSVEEFIKKYAN